MSGMLFMSDWASPDRRVLVSFAETVLEVYELHLQRSPSDCEAGGILLGTLHGSSMLISEATVPTIWDKRMRSLFERMSVGHRRIAERRWRDSAGTVRYLGEWHTHPQDHPLPSGIDHCEWRKLAQKRRDGRPLLAVIAGRRTLHVEMVPAAGTGTPLTPIR